jgi:hypothetical protein
MSDDDETFDDLLRDRFDLGRADISVADNLGPAVLAAALKTLPARRPSAAALSEAETRLLDSAGLGEEPGAYAEVVGDILAHTARLILTAYTEAEVADGLKLEISDVVGRRLARTLWAIDDDGAWVYPVPQFKQFGDSLKLIPGFDQVFPALPEDLHPVVVAGFLLTPQPDLWINDEPTTVQDWLVLGGDVSNDQNLWMALGLVTWMGAPSRG